MRINIPLYDSNESTVGGVMVTFGKKAFKVKMHIFFFTDSGNFGLQYLKPEPEDPEDEEYDSFNPCHFFLLEENATSTEGDDYFYKTTIENIKINKL